MFIGLGHSNLGRVAARDSRLEEAASRLREARDLFRSTGANSMLLEADAREVERLVFAHQSEAALSLADEVRARIERFGGMPYILAMLDRLSAYALWQVGERQSAWTHLAASLERARGAKVDYEIALTLQAMSRVGPLLQVANVEDLARESGDIFSRLGVISTPEVPLGPS
jgi:hypothetical protein